MNEEVRRVIALSLAVRHCGKIANGPVDDSINRVLRISDLFIGYLKDGENHRDEAVAEADREKGTQILAQIGAELIRGPW